MVLMLNIVSEAPAGLMTIGVYIPGNDESSNWLRQDLHDNQGSLRFVFYEDES